MSHRLRIRPSAQMGPLLAAVIFALSAAPSAAAPLPSKPLAAAPEVGLAVSETSAPVEPKSATGLTLETDVQRILRRAEQPGRPPIEAPPDLQATLARSAQGATIAMGRFDMEPLPLIPYSQLASGPPLLFADDPEYIRVPEAAVLREVINPGRNRLYLYHCNGTTGTRSKITAVLENLSDAPMRLRFTRYSFPGVSFDYGDLGRRGIRGFFTATPQEAIEVIPPHAAVPLDRALETTTVRFNELIHAWHEFEIDQPGKLTVLQTRPETPSVEANSRLATLLPPRSKSGAGRGYYPYSEYAIANDAAPAAIDSAAGAQQLFLADGLKDRWATGFDSSSTTHPCVLKGNYGMIYNIALRRKSSDGRGLAAITWNARTKSGCKAFAGCIEVGGTNGKLKPGAVMVPSDKNVVVGGDKAVLLQVYPPLPAGGEDKIELKFTPPGASCLPTPILLIPIDAKYF